MSLSKEMVQRDAFVSSSWTKLLMPEGTREPVDEYPIKCTSDEFSRTRIKNTTRVYECTAARNFSTVDFSTNFKHQNITFVGDSFSRALHGTFICLLKSMDFSLRRVKTNIPCEGTQCTWEHGVLMHRVFDRHLREQFFVTFI